jgi:hypothetical protein
MHKLVATFERIHLLPPSRMATFLAFVAKFAEVSESMKEDLDALGEVRCRDSMEASPRACARVYASACGLVPFSMGQRCVR